MAQKTRVVIKKVDSYKPWFFAMLVVAIIFTALFCISGFIIFALVYDSGKAIVDASVINWGGGEDETNVYFEAEVINYGEREAKDVILKCVVYAENSSASNALISLEGFVGNIGSRSYLHMELEQANQAGSLNNTLGTCFIEACNECEILRERIN